MPESISTKKLREQLREPAGRIRQMADTLARENRDFTSEEKVEWERVNADYNALEERVKLAMQADDIEARMGQSVGHQDLGGFSGGKPRDSDGAALTADDRIRAFQAWAVYHAGVDLTEEQEQVVARCGVNLRSKSFEFSRPVYSKRTPIWQSRGKPDFNAALSGHEGSAGATLVAPGFINSLEIAMLQFGGIRAVADVMTTSTGEPMPWPTANDTSNKGRLIGENKTNVEATRPNFGAVIFNAYEYTSDFILIPWTLLVDSAFNLAQVIGAMLGERLGRITAEHFTTGHGGAMPKGIVPASALGVTGASATAIAADECFDLLHSVDPSYRVGPGVGWMFHDKVLLHLRKLKDGNGRYLWQEGMSAGEPNRFLDYPYTINQEMASSLEASAITMLFGALNKYKIRDVSSVMLVRCDELFTANHQVGFIAFSRHDGNLLDAGTNPVKHYKQAAG